MNLWEHRVYCLSQKQLLRFLPKTKLGFCEGVFVWGGVLVFFCLVCGCFVQLFFKDFYIPGSVYSGRNETVENSSGKNQRALLLLQYNSKHELSGLQLLAFHNYL